MLPTKRDRRKQTRLSFTPAPSSSPSRPEVHVRLNHPVTPSKRHLVLEDSESDSSQVELPATDGKIQRSPGGVNAAFPIQSAATRWQPDYHHNQISSDSDDVRTLPVSRLKKSKTKAVIISSSSEHSEEESPRPKPSRPPTVRSFFVGGASGTAPIPRTPQKSARRDSLLKRSASARIEASSSQVDKNPGEKAPRYNTRQRKRDEGTRSSENADPITPSRRRIEEAVEEDDSDIILASSSRRRRISKHAETPTEEDDDSMLEELGTAGHEESEKRQTRQGQGNSARTKRLEKLSELRKRRAGTARSPNEDEYEDEEEDEQPFTETDVEDTPEENLEDEVEEERGNTDLDEYESDFIEDDGEIGIDLAKHGVPLELTGHANKKQYDYFKHAVEWMVHNKLDPAFERNDEIYEMAHKKLNDEFLGLASSEFKSSVWTPGFTKALQSRPEFSMVHLGFGLMEDKCQACNRTRHPAKWAITFSGPTYDPRSLEKVSPKDANESSESDEETDEAGDNEEKWMVGSVCCANAEVTHSLYHWRFQLNATVLEWLAINKYIEPLQIVEREDWPRRKKEKFANKIVDSMVENGEMESLYKEFKENLNAAIAARAEKTQHGGWKGKRR